MKLAKIAFSKKKYRNPNDIYIHYTIRHCACPSSIIFLQFWQNWSQGANHQREVRYLIFRLSLPKLHDNLQPFSVTNNNFSRWMFCQTCHTRFVTLALFWWSLMISSIWSSNSSRKISDKREKRNPRSLYLEHLKNSYF